MFAKAFRFRMNTGMKLAACLPTSFAIALILSSCGAGSRSSSSQLSNTGPFDRNGNYVEEWADNPSKWRKSGSPPSPHDLKSDRLPEIVTNDQPPANAVPLPPRPVISNSIPKTQVVTRVTTSTTTTTSKPVLVKVKPKPKPVAKAAPKPVRYVVKKGDTLSSIASRTGSTVGALRGANGISGSVIRPGQALTIPKR